MIAKIAPVHGRDAMGLVRYLFGPGRGDEHRDQRVIAADEQLEVDDGTRLDTSADWERVLELGYALDDHRLAAGTEPPGGWVWHCAISLPPGEHLDDAAWAEVARAAVARLGFDDSGGQAPCRWLAVHHGPSAGGNDHIHLAVNLVRADQRVARPGRDRIAMSTLCRELEHRYGLRIVEGRARRGLPGLSRAEVERARRTGAEPDRVVLARHVRAAAMAASTEAEFVRRLKVGGVWVRPRYGVGGREAVVGYCVALAPAPGGKAVWFGGGKLAADLTLPKLRATWSPDSADQALAEWSATSARITAPGRSEAPIADPAAWTHAAQLVDGVRRSLAELPAGDPRWIVACRGAAAVMAALALRFEPDRPGALSAAADRLAWSAQDPHWSPDRAGLAGQQMRRDVGAAVRIISQAAGSPNISTGALVVIVGAVLLAKAIAELHKQRSQPHQARVLTGHTRALAGQVAGLAPWERRPHGSVPTPRLKALADAIEADVDRLVRTERRIAELTEAAQDGRGPMAGALRTRRQELEQAAAAEKALPAARSAAAQADRRVAAWDDEVRYLKERSEKGRVWLRMQGTSRDEVLEDLARARDKRGAARRLRDRAHADLDALAATARTLYDSAPTPRPWTPGAATAAHRELCADWPAKFDRAVADDVDAAKRARIIKPTPAEVAAPSFPCHGARRPATSLADARRQLQAVRAELALREVLPVAVARAEKNQRAAAQPPPVVRSPAPQPSPRRTPPRQDRGRGGRGR